MCVREGGGRVGAAGRAEGTPSVYAYLYVCGIRLETLQVIVDRHFL